MTSSLFATGCRGRRHRAFWLMYQFAVLGNQPDSALEYNIRMEQITIRIKDRQKARKFLSFLKTLDFVESITNADFSAPKMPTQDADFFALAGLWAGRDISLKTLREKAWPYRV